MEASAPGNPNQVIASKRAEAFRNDESVEITIAPNAGACFGVVRAIKLGHQAVAKASSAENPGQVVTFGPLIHNPKVVSELEGLGVQAITDPSLIQGGTVVLRSHGVRREIEKNMKDRGIAVVDATCPLVKKPQRIATSLGEKGFFLVVVGDEKHPEVQGVLSYFGRPDFLVTYRPEDVDKIPKEITKVGVIAQTTIEHRVFQTIVDRCREKFAEVAVHNTICDATSVRQREAETIARSADVVIVVGGRNSSNTRKLEKICRDFQPATFLIEELNEIRLDWFDGKRKIGVTGGASTPMEYVDQVGEKIAEMIRTERGLG